MKSITTAAAALMSLSVASAAVTSHCINGNQVCYKWAVPQGSSDAIVQIEAPSSYEWAALGIGRSMSSARVFLIYQDGSGNVTLSTREASGHVQPQHVEMKGVSLIEGSGVKNGKMTANVLCKDCSGLDNSGMSNWIAAYRSGGSFESKANDADISIHNGNDAFNVDLSKASVTTSPGQNPFASGTPGNKQGGGASGNSGNNDAVSGAAPVVSPKVIAAHGIVMAIAFAVLYPLGAALMPLVGKWWVHGAFQIIAYILMWVGFGLGYHYANKTNSALNDYHQKIGIAVVALLGIQPILGYLHHVLYKRKGGRTIVSHIHIWYGRALMVLGVVNGGLGLKLQTAANNLKVAYGVVSGVLFGLYIGSAIWGMIKRSRAPLSPSERVGSSNGSPKTEAQAQQANYASERSDEAQSYESHRPRY